MNHVPEINPELLGLLRACKDALDDDVPRLVLADWLLERDGPTDADRAALIRIQCEMAHAEEGSPAWCAAAAASGRLQHSHREAWKGPLASDAVFDRGLLDLFPSLSSSFSSEVRAWLESEDAVWVATLRLVAFSGREAGQFAAEPFLSHLARLQLRFSWNEPTNASALLASPHLIHLRTLSFCGVSQAEGDDVAEALAAWPGLAGLASLTLSESFVGDRGAAALAASPHARNLRTLGLHFNQLTDAGATALASSPHLANLRQLWLARNPIGDAGAQALAGLKNLERLSISKGGHPALSRKTVAILRQRFGHAVSLGGA